MDIQSVNICTSSLDDKGQHAAHIIITTKDLNHSYSEHTVANTIDEKEFLVIALATALGFEPSELLNLECLRLDI